MDEAFLKWQGLSVKINIIYQYNTSSINLEDNVKQIWGKQTNNFDINYFYVTDMVG